VIAALRAVFCSPARARRGSTRPRYARMLARRRYAPASILAVDRFVRALESRSEEADRDIRRLKTVARIAPHLDLGQDD
jgi:hypothetical protein